MSEIASVRLMAEQNPQQFQQQFLQPTHRDDNGNTLIILAAEQRSLPSLHWLLQHGHSPNMANWNGDTALHSAALAGWTDGVHLLLHAGANPNSTNIRDETPLHFASSGGHLASMHLLILAGAMAGAADADGDSPLHWAVREDKLAAVDYLVRFAVQARTFDLNAVNEDDETPLDLAQDMSPVNADIVRVLADAGAVRRSVPVEKQVITHPKFVVTDKDQLSSSFNLKQQASVRNSSFASTMASCSPDISRGMSQLSLQA